MPLNQGIESTKEEILNWYSNKEILTIEKESLLVYTDFFFEQFNDLNNLIQNNKLKVESSELDSIVTIKEYLEEADSKKIKENYFLRKEGSFQSQKILLKESISATETLLAFKETVQLIKELVKYEPTSSNYARLGFYLKKLSNYNDAIENYKKVVEIEKVNINRNFDDDITLLGTFNNMSLIYLEQGKLKKASKYLNEAKNIVKKYPGKRWNSEKAMIYNNRGLIYENEGKPNKAEKKFSKALAVYRKLSEENFDKYISLVALLSENLARLDLNAEWYNKDKKIKESNRKIMYLEEVIEIYEQLSINNPTKYKPLLANSLSNLSLELSYNNDYQGAKIKYEESLRIYSVLMKENPSEYELDYVRIISVGIKYFQKEKKAIEEIKNILLNYPNNSYALDLKNFIKSIE